MAEPSDEDLMECIARGDSGAFRILSERYMKLLFSAAYRLGISPHEAEDIVQETMLKVWQKADRWDSGRGASVKTWLYRIAYNTAVDDRRKYRESIPIEEQKLSLEATVEKDIEAQQKRALVKNALNALPSRQRQALVLSHYEELSNAQTAEIMGTTIKAVEGLLTRARQSLHENFQCGEGV